MKKPLIEFSKDSAPIDFSDRQKKYFHYYANRLKEIKLIEKFDFESLVNIALMADLRDSLTDEIRATGMTFESEGRNGVQKKINPAVTQLTKVLNDLRQFYKDYGLTPRPNEMSLDEAPKQDDNPFGNPMKIISV